MKINNVPSLFDGISCGQIALNRSNIQYNNYYASEIDKNAIKVTQHNYPNTIQLGDVRLVNTSILDNVDLLIGGSPCQGFSYAGDMLNFNDPRSKLFFEFVRIKNEIKPKYFLMENVWMKKQWVDIITKELGVEPILINSNLVSGQERKRYYWTNIPINGLPSNKNIHIHDIIGKDKYYGAIRGRKINGNDFYTQVVEYKNDGKSNCLTTVPKDNIVIDEFIESATSKSVKYRYYTPNEYEILQTIPLDYTKVVSDNIRRKLIGNSWTVDIISHIFSGIKE